MPSAQLVIDHILETKSIKTYLETKGIFPTKSLSGGKLAYHCPLPDHNESKPSFILFTNSQYENYYCFGCSSHSNIINLVAGMEGISWREALKRLGDGFEITPQEEAKILIDKCTTQATLDRFGWEMPETLLLMSSYCRSYLDSVNNDTEECCIIDRFWSVIDNDLREYEFDKIEESVRYVPAMLRFRRSQFEIKKRKKLIEQYASKNNAT